MKKILSAKSILALVLVGVMAIASPANAGAVGTVTGEITVSCYDSMVYKSFLEYAARSFEAKYPGAKVKIDAFSAMPDVQTLRTEDESGMVTVTQRVDYRIDTKAQSDYITRINTEMISGGGADIYAIDVLPYYKYADSGMFEDLRGYMDNDPDFDYEDYQKNIFDAVMYAGGQYILPLDYSFNCLSYDTTLMDPEAVAELGFGRYTYEQLMKLGYDAFVSRYDPNAENQIRLINLYTGYSGLSFYSEMMKLNYNSFVDIENKNANFTDGRFAQILNNAKEYEEKGYINEQPNRYMSYLYETWVSLTGLLNIDYLSKSPAAEFYINFYGLSGLKDDALIGMLADDNGKSPFITTQAYALNSNSKNKDTAWAFLRFLLSDEIQGSTSLRHHPVNRKIATQTAKVDLYAIYSAAQLWKEEKIDFIPVAGNISDEAGYANGDIIFSRSVGDDIKFDESQQEIYEIYMDYIDRYAALINAYTIRDIIIDGIIETEVKKFFDGSRTADEVALTLQNKVSIYLQE